MMRWLPTIAALFLAPMLIDAQVQYALQARYEGDSTEVKFSVPASAGDAGTYCFQVRAIRRFAGTEVPSAWSNPACAQLAPPVTVTLAWDPASSSPSLPEGGWIHVAYEVRLGPGSVSANVDTSSAKTSESMFDDSRPELDYQEKRAYELGARFVSERGGQIVALRFWKGPKEIGPHTGRVWSSDGHLLAEVVFENESQAGWHQQQLPKPVAVKANTPFVISVTTDPNGYYVVTPDDVAQPRKRGSLRADFAVFGPLGKFPRTRRPDNFFRDLVFVPEP